MKNGRWILLCASAWALAALLPTRGDAQCVSLTTSGVAATQNFDALSNTAGSTTNTLTLTGWFLTESGGGTRDNELYGVDTGASNTGDTYSYGSAAATDRALGGLRSGTLIPIFGACYTNNTGAAITSLAIAYTGEQWRLGTAARTDQIDFQYSLNATDLVTGTWVDVNALDFVSPVTTTVGAKDGNLAANRSALSSSIAALSIAPGASFWIRWTDLDATSADDGLAVDDFSLTPTAGAVVNADLSVTLTDSPDPVTAGTTLTYTAVVTNGGSGSATDVTATLTLPASTTFVSANPGAGGSCSGTGPVVCTWAGATANGATRTVTVTVSVPAAAANSSLLSAQVVVSSLSNDPVPGNNTATAGSAVITRADMAITLTDTPDPVVAGAVLTYTASATNGGASDAQDVAITLNLPAEGTLQSASAGLGGSCSGTGPVVCSWAGATAPTAQRTATVAVTIASGTPAGTQVFADAQVGTATGDPVSGNNSASTGTLVTAQADVSITLVDSPDPVVAGTQLSYLATLSNNGISAAPDAAITLPLPAGTTLVSATPSAGGNCTTGASVVCTWLGATAVGGTRTASVVVTVSSAQTAALSATATASSAATDPNNGNNSATATTAVNVSADLSITLSDAPDPVAGGTQLTYTAVVSNAGPSDATGVTVTLPLPANTTLVSGNVVGGGSCAGSPVVCSVSGSIAAGGSRTATIVLAVDPSAPDGTLTATATVAAASPDPNLGNNSASTTTTVVTQADLLLTLTSSATQVELNVPVTFTATSLNQGPSAAQDVSITLTLTPDFRYASHTASAGAVCTTPQVGNTGAIVCTWAGATAAGATRTLAVSAYSNTEGNSAVNASTSSPTPDPVANNNASAVSVQVGLGVREIPTLDSRGLLLLSLLLSLIGATLLRKR